MFLLSWLVLLKKKAVASVAEDGEATTDKGCGGGTCAGCDVANQEAAVAFSGTAAVEVAKEDDVVEE